MEKDFPAKFPFKTPYVGFLDSFRFDFIMIFLLLKNESLAHGLLCPCSDLKMKLYQHLATRSAQSDLPEEE